MLKNQCYSSDMSGYIAECKLNEMSDYDEI